MQFDVIIIGGGPGGYTAAIYAAKQKMKVALIEKEKIGGTCLNVGCIPTKALIHSSDLYREIKDSDKFGITSKDVEINWGEIQKNKNSIVDNLTNGVKGLLRQNKVQVFEGTGKIIGRNSVSILNNSVKTTIEGENIIIASGSVPIDIRIPGSELEEVGSSTKALSYEKIPKSLAIIGGGVIGVEMAYIYNTLGSKVTILEMLPKILGRMDSESSNTLKQTLESQGIDIYTEARALSIEKNRELAKVKFETKTGVQEISVEKVLVSVGRKPNLDVIGKLDIKISKKGIIIDDYLRTNIPNIYAIGDVTGKLMLAHVASHQGITAVKNIIGERTRMNYNVVPSCIYTNPEMASVGLTEEEAKEKYNDEIIISVFPFGYNGKSMTIGETNGFVKIIADKKYSGIIGVHIVGPHATELIAEAALAIQLECTVEELIETIHAHPTLSEAILEAALGIDDEAIHIFKSRK
ncbi:dihydrolipoyl dehydrogenase [Maledivibacter halophilus]|uniref:Dihydrolipoyl dehydrogenase n=1 Tax=Maledivibacter halophilus TaxID=36842 RepID=A0A1T5ME73_9FIRM|nr:dihydrolipoyl dehydrogenase [Maledivibacter halophilus]SKC86520.1 dihydrolipoamide dehydrogenase [Maledivibacter halophilus]